MAILDPQATDSPSSQPSRAALVLYLNTARAQWWKDHLGNLLPEFECRLWTDEGDPTDVRYAVVWRPPTGWLKQFSNLRCIFSVGAGIDHILEDKLLPDVPVIRTTGEDLTQRMREYICLHVLRLHRRSMDTEKAQRERRWHNQVIPVAGERVVGIMGLGNLGTACAESLLKLGFNVTGWARSKHNLTGINCYAGDAELAEFLNDIDILVCLLPLTPATDNILSSKLFNNLPAGACIINAGRGAHLVEDDLLQALNTGHIAHATLDVFRQEPLPDDHPFWQHPQITVTPHVASMIDPESGGKEIAANLRRFENGEPIADLASRDRGY
jgi:glyoxylate/hydroxypyruvate reductase A